MEPGDEEMKATERVAQFCADNLPGFRASFRRNYMLAFAVQRAAQDALDKMRRIGISDATPESDEERAALQAAAIKIWQIAYDYATGKDKP